MLSIKLIIYLRCRAGWFIAVSLHTWHNGFPARWVSLWIVPMDFLLNLIFQKWLTTTPVLGELKWRQIQVGISRGLLSPGAWEARGENGNWKLWSVEGQETLLIYTPHSQTCIYRLHQTKPVHNLELCWALPTLQRWDEMTFGSSLHCVFISFR